MVFAQGLRSNPGDFLDPRNLPQIEDRPTHGFCLEGNGALVVLDRGDYCRVPVLCLAALDVDFDVLRRTVGGRHVDLPAVDRSGGPGSTGQGQATSPETKQKGETCIDLI